MGNRLAITSALALLACTNESPLTERRPQLTTPMTFDLGTPYVGQVSHRELIITNSGTADVTLHAASSTAPELIVTLPALRVLAHETARVQLAWTPTSPGPLAATLTLISSAGTNIVQLTGEALAPSACDDHNDCTTDAFNLATAACEHIARVGSCDDQSACTQDDVCVNTECQGVAITCDDGDACTLDVCDANVGCVARPDATICDDDNPCTSDLCSAGACSYAPIADYNPCPGERITCAGWPVCLAGACEVLPTPDGFPCNDGSFCTTSDVCHGGVCTGAPSPSDPVLMSMRGTFARAGDRVVILPSGRAVSAGSISLGDEDERAIVVSADLGASVLRPSAPLILDQQVLGLAALGNDAVLVMGIGVTRVIELDDAGTPSVRATVALSAVGSMSASHGDFVYLVGQSVLRTIDLRDLDAPVVWPTIGLAGYASKVALDAEAERLWIATDTGLHAYDLSNPTQPVLVETLWANVIVDDVVLDGPRLLATPRGEGLVIHDRASRIELARHDGLFWYMMGRVDAGLVVMDAPGTVLRLLDLSDPTLPLRLAEAVSDFTDMSQVAAGEWIALARNDGGYRASQFMRVTASGFTPVTGPGHGDTGVVVPSDQGFTSYAPGAVFSVGLDDPTSPEWLVGAGGLPTGAGRMFARSAQGTGRLLSRYPPGTALVSVLPSYDVSDLSQPSFAGALSVGTGTHYLVGDSAGRFTYDFRQTWTGSAYAWQLRVIDWQDAGTVVGGELVPVASLQISSALASNKGTPILDESTSRLAFIDGLKNVWFFDVATPTAPTVVAGPFTLDEYPNSDGGMALYGDRLLVPRFAGVDLDVFEWSQDGLTLVGSLGHALASGYSADVLAFDGALALVSVLDRVLFIDTTVSPFVVVHEVALDLPAKHAASVDDNLVLSSPHGFSVLYPPCPPL